MFITEWTVQASKIYRASVPRIHDWLAGWLAGWMGSLSHRHSRQSDHQVHHWAGVGVWFWEKRRQKQPSTCAESTQHPLGVSTEPVRGGPEEGGQPSPLCCFPVVFQLLPCLHLHTSGSICFPKAK